MYSTCLFCLGALGRNEALAWFPVGRRLAFDPARGRLWAVCGGCGRWNLAPIEERWDAVEECERQFRASHQRYGTGNIGLAGLRDGTELVRIGPALRPEIAVWRYGARLLRQRATRRQSLARASAAVILAGTRAARWLRSGPSPVTSEEQALQLVTGLAGPGQRGERVLAIVRRDSARDDSVRPDSMHDMYDDTASTPSHAWVPTGNDVPTAILRRRHLATAHLVRPEQGEPWQLEIAHELGPIRLSGAEGLRASARLLATVNQYESSPSLIADAVRKVDDAMEPDGYFRRVLASAWHWQWGRFAHTAGDAHDALPAHAAPAVTTLSQDLAVQLTGRSFWAHGGMGSAQRMALLRVPAVDRLALEMVAHEAAERVALDVELDALSEAWRDAEEIAAIADAL
ncbi:MAG: hypothetical protein V4617_03435 [Gemmatimonadota bacterium]